MLEKGPPGLLTWALPLDWEGSECDVTPFDLVYIPSTNAPTKAGLGATPCVSTCHRPPGGPRLSLTPLKFLVLLLHSSYASPPLIIGIDSTRSCLSLTT